MAIDIAAAATIAVSPIFGSFIGVAIRRLPAGRPIAVDRSRCDTCDAILGPLELAPLLSYAAQRGRCRHCGGRIGLFHPAVELAAVAVSAMAAALSPPESFFWDCALGWALLALAWIDAETGLLPDLLTLPLIAAGIAQAWVAGGDPVDSPIGAVAGYGFVRLIGIGYRRWRGRDGIGLGDAKLLAAAGAWLGWENLAMTVLVASLSALLFVAAQTLGGRSVGRDTSIPFGPFLALGIWVVRLIGAPGYPL
jgi:leader peptidase (prepilin peptidase)/N-methyltransferase